MLSDDSELWHPRCDHQVVQNPISRMDTKQQQAENRNPHKSLPKSIARQFMSENGLKNKKKGRNRRKNQWKLDDFVVFALGDGANQNKKDVKQNPKHTKVKLMNPTGSGGELFKQLPREILFKVFSFLSLNDNAVKSILYISRNITLTMLNIDDFGESSFTGQNIQFCEYFRLLTFLKQRKEIEDIENYVRNRKTFLKTLGDLHSASSQLQTEWNVLSFTQQLNEFNKKKSKFVSLIQNEQGRFSASDIKYKLLKSLKIMNNLFPGWLSPFLQSDITDMQSMNEIIERSANLKNLRDVIHKNRKVGIPVVTPDASESIAYNERIDAEVKEMLFAKKASSRSRKQRNWKQELSRLITLRSIRDKIKDTIYSLTQNTITGVRYGMRKNEYLRKVSFGFTRQLRPPEYSEHAQFHYSHDFKDNIYSLMDLLKMLNDKSRYFYLFTKSYAHGKNRLASNFKNRPNGHVNLFQNLLSLFNMIAREARMNKNILESVANLRRSSQITPAVITIRRGCEIVQPETTVQQRTQQQSLGDEWNFNLESQTDFIVHHFTQFVAKNWKYYCISKYCSQNIRVDYDRFMIDFLLDGSRHSFRNFVLLGDFMKIFIEKHTNAFNKFGKMFLDHLNHPENISANTPLIRVSKFSSKLKITPHNLIPMPTTRGRGRGRGRGQSDRGRGRGGRGSNRGQSNQ
ncbi:hypothetical protein C9374_003159 [Naegleria lovaniensis]|uniref:Uncharacterized protein n=1 Tax=Naegleria lovaniensis TaxID=51637 RepID=A0AA88GSF6_NAELO|nr:uncharacterized protein C9374_003159 [Naegleria lovaniensis]KAG2386010.1 hypothetical protein C9374_003159 [Naegleria lovaniensis]